MKTIKELQDIINTEIASISYPEYPKELYEPISYILEGQGKRLRPLLMLLAYGMYREDIQMALKPALGLEMFHNFTLVHDDIMDKAPIRRNKTTIHIKWNENTAILSGDAMMILAYQFFFDLPAQIQQQALKLFTQTALQVCEGQQLDMNFETRTNVSVSEYLIMIRLKTAVLLACSLSLGALIAQAPQNDVQTLYEVGIDLGLAFQLQDDWLDVFANQDVFGKQIGNDIVTNKKTYLYLLAYEKADANQKNKLDFWFTEHSDDLKKKVEAVTQLYKEMNISKITKITIESYIHKALSKLDSLSVPQEKTMELRKIFQQIVDRNK